MSVPVRRISKGFQTGFVCIGVLLCSRLMNKWKICLLNENFLILRLFQCENISGSFYIFMVTQKFEKDIETAELKNDAE